MNCQIEMPEDDLAFLRRVRELGVGGRTQDQIAAELGLTRTKLRNRLAGLGFEFVPANDIRATLTKQPLAELFPEQAEQELPVCVP